MGEIKLWKVMFGNKVNDAARFEKVLDCVLALHNLKILVNKDPNFVIPVRRSVVPDDHIFKQKMALNLQIPAAPAPKVLQNSPHIAQFEEFMKHAVGCVRKWLHIGGDDCLFSPTVGQRALISSTVDIAFN